jgi:flagellar biosynthesis/type III secretory pathway ATPase
MTVEITIDPTTRMCMLAQVAHRHVDATMFQLRQYKRIIKKLEAARDFRSVIEAITEAKAELDQAVANWATVQEILKQHPELQEVKQDGVQQ